jgi:hypothetical protein
MTLSGVSKMVEFQEKSRLGGWTIDVVVDGVTIGRIRKHAQDGSYVYFRGLNNQLTGSLRDHDLEDLKRRIESSLP